MHTNELKIIGSGGHGRVVLDALLSSTKQYNVSFCDDNPQLLHKEINGILVNSTLDSLKNYQGFVHISIGNNRLRTQIAKSLDPLQNWLTITHPQAIISQRARLGDGVFIAAGAIIAPDAELGSGTIVNHGAIVDHDVVIGFCSHIAPNATLGGAVKIGKGVLIGSGAVLLPGIRIGDGATIGSGAVVVKDVKENTTVKGVPAV